MIRKIIKTVIWSAVERLVPLFIQLSLLMFLARLINPESFALMGIITIFLAIAQSLIDSGFASALIRDSSAKSTHYSTTFYFNIICGIVIYLIIYILSPLIADFYGNEILKDLIKFVGLNIIFSSFAIVPRAKLTINLSFKSQSIGTLIATILSGIIGILLAKNGFGVWSIAIQSVSQCFFTTIFLMYLCQWRPTKEFDINIFKSYFSYGYKILLAGLLDSFFRNIYVPIISKRFGLEIGGYFSQAQRLAELPSVNIGVLIQRVFLPLLVKNKKNNIQIDDIYMFSLVFSAIIIFPFMTLIAINSKEIILLLLGKNWINSAVIFSILCFSFMIYPIQLLTNNLYQLHGHSGNLLLTEIQRKCCSIVILFISINYNVEFVAYGILISSIVSFLIGVINSRKMSNIIQFRVMGIIIALWGGCYGFFYYSNEIENITSLNISVIFSILYIIISFFLLLFLLKARMVRR